MFIIIFRLNYTFNLLFYVLFCFHKNFKRKKNYRNIQSENKHTLKNPINYLIMRILIVTKYFKKTQSVSF